jgi:hypothetical protein
MKQYQQKEYGGKWEKNEGYRHKYRKRKASYKPITYPWKNQLKSIQAT